MLNFAKRHITNEFGERLRQRILGRKLPKSSRNLLIESGEAAKKMTA